MSGSYAFASQRDSDVYPSAAPVLDEAELRLIARTDAFVLLTARAHVRTLALKIHDLKGQRKGTFRAVDCGAPPDVLERELFDVLKEDSALPPGTNAGGAGTLFLHEVGALSAAAQVRLRDAIAFSATGPQAQGLRRRLIASTSDPLLPRVLNGTFDDRLFYLLNVMHFEVAVS